jgi:hypothetical protein
VKDQGQDAVTDNAWRQADVDEAVAEFLVELSVQLYSSKPKTMWADIARRARRTARTDTQCRV